MLLFPFLFLFGDYFFNVTLFWRLLSGLCRLKDSLWLVLRLYKLQLIGVVQILHVKSFSLTGHSFVGLRWRAGFLMDWKPIGQESSSAVFTLSHHFRLKSFGSLSVVSLNFSPREFIECGLGCRKLLGRFGKRFPFAFGFESFLVFSLFSTLLLVNRKWFGTKFSTTNVAN